MADEETPEEASTEEANEDTVGTVVTAGIDDAGGFHFSIAPNLPPVILAGIAWYLEAMANIGLGNMMQQQAQLRAAAEAKKPKLFLGDHLPKKRN
jgi:hypothetical protein